MNRYGWLFLTLLSIFLTVSTCRGEAGPKEDPTPAPELCQSALSACDQLQRDQDEQIKALQEQSAAWKKQAEKGIGSEAPITLYTVISGAAGGAVASEVKGQSGLVGGAAGGLIGLIIGLAIEGLAR